MPQSCLVPCAPLAPKTCPSCRAIIVGLGGGIGRVTFCLACFDKHCKVRSARSTWMLSHQDRLESRWKQYRRAAEELAGLQQQKEDVKAAIRADVAQEVVSTIRQFSFWSRLKLLFSPFGFAWADIEARKGKTK